MGFTKSKMHLITGIDIGSSAVRIAVGQAGQKDNGKTNLQIIGAIEVVAEGVQRGVVTSIEDAVSALSGGIEQMERLIGLPIEHAWIGVGGINIICQESKGVIAVAKSDGEIADEDVERVVEQARNVAPPLNYQIIHITPRGYSVDGQTGIKDPTGMTGIRLEVDTQIIHGLSSHVSNIERSVHRTGLAIDDLVLSIVAGGSAVTTSRQRDLGVAVVNIGASITSLVIYEEGDIVHVATMPIGSEHVTNDLAIGLKTSIDVAERVKINYGQSVSKSVPKKDKVDLAKLGAEQSEEVSRHYISEIIEARMVEILEKVDEEMMKVERSGLLPAGVLFSGGGSKLTGITDLAKEVLNLPAALGYPVDIISSSEKINDLSFTTAIGLVKWGASLQSSKEARSGIVSSIVTKSWGKTKNFFKTLIP